MALRNELHLSGTVTSVDTAKMTPIAARLENLADHLDFDVQQWLYRDRQQFRGAALQASNKFRQRTQTIHRILASRPTATELNQHVSDLIEEWRGIYQYLGRCQTPNRSTLARLAGEIRQSIYDVSAPLQL